MVCWSNTERARAPLRIGILNTFAFARACGSCIGDQRGLLNSVAKDLDIDLERERKFQGSKQLHDVNTFMTDVLALKRRSVEFMVN